MKNPILINAKNKTLGELINFLTKIIKFINFKKKNTIYIMNINYTKINKKIYYRHSGYPGGIKKYIINKLNIENYKNLLRKSIIGNLKKSKFFKNFINHIKIIKNHYLTLNNKPKIITYEKLNI